MKKNLKLTDILVTILISIVFGIVYKIWGPVSGVMSSFGLHIDELVYGMWFIAAAVAYLIIRKAGVAFLAEVAAASGELLMGSEYGVIVLVYGIVQGLFAEAVFASFRYKRFDLLVVSLAGASSAVGSLLLDLFRGYLLDLVWWSVTLKVFFRIVGGIFFTGFVAYALVKALEKTGVTKLLRPASKEDYESLSK
ncbi:ECF transporter S component [Sutcliffiella cohnii]|uniref:Thiamine ABC transporter permease n=1 Tax=Sutcliffiella cohnii TaxID=33932 RepID=A0A223KM12_9BACI|nr:MULTISPECIES: ECF transporter S component [Sutcliffiella]AST90436.1 thiamine ABC transporter permease [Sutcliffiella cohnii]MED4017448.1 ECF transporter S component [Sutcliffiella cohnii]WBL16090.1 ECF transporter S component [Sutcliffiella sp. NC1]